MRALLAFLLLAAPAVQAASAKRPVKARPEAAMSRVEEVSGGRFKAAAPKGWRVTKDREGTGLQVTGPAAPDAPAPTASAVYYAKGNPHFKDAADFLARQTAPSPVPIQGEKTGPVEEAKLSGRPAKSLRRDTFAVHRAPAAEPREVAVREELTVLQGKEGFWVVTVSAPAAAWAKQAAAFAAFRDGFKAND
ncbi:hypothetical protein EPO15_06990 [bacterium]|nr:MAG: hypothetical protein EPO15_06990 [bacterium]